LVRTLSDKNSPRVTEGGAGGSKEESTGPKRTNPDSEDLRILRKVSYDIDRKSNTEGKAVDASKDKRLASKLAEGGKRSCDLGTGGVKEVRKGKSESASTLPYFTGLKPRGKKCLRSFCGRQGKGEKQTGTG